MKSLQALKKADKQVLEPLMSLEVTVTRDYLSPVLADLAQRRGNIQEIQTRQDNRVVIGFVPLAEIMVSSLRLNCTYCLIWRSNLSTTRLSVTPVGFRECQHLKGQPSGMTGLWPSMVGESSGTQPFRQVIPNLRTTEIMAYCTKTGQSE